MIKNHLRELIDVKLIVIVVVIIAVATLLSLFFSDKVKDFTTLYKKKFYIYIFSFVLTYALIAFLGYNKLFVKLSSELLFYQIISLFLGILHVYLYRSYFENFNLERFNLQSVSYELLFSFLVTLYSSVLFIIIFTGLNGISFTYLIASHFIVLIIPTGVYILFNCIMSIPAKEYLTWKIPSDAKDVYPDIESEEMIDLLLIKFLIRKNEDDLDYASIRAKAPVRIDFGELFYHTTKNYNDKYDKDLIQLKDDNGQNYNWVFFFESKWYQSTKYIDPEHSLGSNLVTENSVIICERRKEAKLPTSKKKKNEDIQEVLLLEGSASSEGKIDNINKSIK